MVYDLLDLTTLTTVRVGDAPQPQPQPRARGKRATRRKQEDAPDLVNMSAAQIAALPRAALLLRSEGGRGNEAFVEGATEVRVRGARDLVRVLVHGQLRRAVHATGLNAGSSRSHAVFQAKLVKIRRAATVDPLDGVSAGARASVRTMTVVDLAGSERAKRTHTQGERLAEAGKINVGLMTLKKCLDVKRFNAGLPDGDPGVQLVPYNESKVTRLFQPALEGGARTCMVVCVDPYEHVGAEPGAAYAEIKGVLEFARVASELVTQVRRVEDPAEVLSESPTGVRAGAAGADSDDDEEVFFDSKGLRASALPMPPPPLVLKRSNAVANARAAAEAEADPAKRQRRDMAGSWQPPPSPSPAMARAMLQATERRAPVATPQRSRPTPAVLEPGSANPMPVPTSVWESITRNSPFSFDLPPSRVHREAPLLLSQTFAMHSEQKREITYLREALARAQTQISAGQTHAEVDELVAYADALERTLGQVRLRYGALQERAVCVEEETRAEVSRFFLAKVAELKQAAGERLRDEVARCEVKAAHKIDILSRLRSARGSQSDSDSDDGQGAGVDAAQVPTVSPRSAVRRAVSRAASKKANKLASVSAGENAELHNLRSTVESLESRMSALSTELELAGQKRDAEREIRATLEVAVAEANAEVAALAAQNKAILAQPQQSGNAQMAVTLVHERERAELLAQITMLKTQLKEADTQAKYARRLWEVQEMLPMQERLRVVKETRGRGGTGADDSAGIADASSVARLQVELDQVWEWFTQEQQKNTELSARFDVLVRKTRKNLAERQILQQQQREEEGEDGEGQAGSDGQMDSDDGSFHMVSLTSAEAISAINGGNPLGVSTLPVAVPGAAGATSQASFATNSTQALSRVMSKSRVLHHRGQSKSQQQIMTRDSSDSFTHHTAAGTLSTAASAQAGGRQHAKLEGAKRVVSRVFNHFTPEAKRRGGGGDGSVLPYMAGRYAHTDTAVGSYSAEVVSFEQGGAGLGLRPRGDTMGAEARQDKVRSIVYSGPIVAHPTGGVSVTFTSEEVHDLPFVAEADDEDYEDEDEDMEIMDITSANGDEDTGSAQGTKRSRSMMRRPPALLPSVDVEYEEQPVVDHGDAAAAAAARSYNSENARQNHRSVSSSHPPFTEVPLRGYQSPTDSIVTTADV
ncbi:Kinesin-like protein kif23, partial [Kickxella alabastrina]